VQTLTVRLASLFSGGKDSTYSLLLARELNHEIACLITMHPPADDSLLFHYPNSRIAKLLSEAMQIPLVEHEISGRTKNDERKALQRAVAEAKRKFAIEGVVSGGISSRFQKESFDEACKSAGLETVAPVWGREPAEYMRELLARGFRIIIVGVSAMGLGKEWLGATLDDASLEKLAALSKKHGFNLNFEGGEAETLVVDCPLYQKRLEIRKAEKRWDGQRGIFEIREAALVEK
jgi:ABC transporter with metal-binding/Fe-S-binding domain ATP-binding protein